MQEQLEVCDYRIAGNFRGAKIFVVFMVGGMTTNILTTNEATLPTFTCSASSYHENITNEMSSILHIHPPTFELCSFAVACPLFFYTPLTVPLIWSAKIVCSRLA